MTRRAVARGLYRMLMALHPRAFRERFGAEMLWVFDQSAEAGVLGLLADGALSVAKQRFSDDATPPGAVVRSPFQEVPVHSLSGRRVVQATFLSALTTLGFFQLLTQSVPLPRPPKTFVIRRASWELCPIYRQAVKRHPDNALGCEASH